MNSTKPVCLIPRLSLDLPRVPAIPVVIDQWPETLLRLTIRALEIAPALQGLSNLYTIQGLQAPAASFLFDPTNSATYQSSLNLILYCLTDNPLDLLNNFKTRIAPPQAVLSSTQAPPTQTSADQVCPPALTELSLNEAQQFALSWTNYANVYAKAFPSLEPWANSLMNADVATESFWPLLSQYALAYNLLVVQKITPAQLAESSFGFDKLPSGLTDLAAKGQLYAIDLSLFTRLDSEKVGDEGPFTPASFTFLQKDLDTKNQWLRPIAIWVARRDGEGKQIYWRYNNADVTNATDAAWLYALQAVKTSLTVYGIWLGHVYQWHIIPAAMQMTMYNTLSDQHPVYQLLQPQSNYLMAFNNILMFLWPSIAPPTSLSAPYQFLNLINQYADQRTYLDDDPQSTLARQGIEVEDFTLDQPWDQYPVVGQFLDIWEATEQYIQTFVLAVYSDDIGVTQDTELQLWLSESRDSNGGNVPGIPTVQTRSELIAVLTSLLYRITIHGVSRLIPSANPALTFVANYPPCLEKSTIPPPDSQFNTAELLTYLPRTGTIGKMVTFYFTFSFSVPYVPFIPQVAADADLSFQNEVTDSLKQALNTFQMAIQRFIERYYPYNPPQYQQWPLNIET